MNVKDHQIVVFQEAHYGYVYLSNKDILRLSKFTKLKYDDFIKLYCDKTDGFTHFKEKKNSSKCQFFR